MTQRAKLPARLRFVVLRRDRYRCRYCGARAPEVALHVDHVRPVAEGGTDALSNLVTACERCNLGKGTMHAGDARRAARRAAQLVLTLDGPRLAWTSLPNLDGELNAMPPAERAALEAGVDAMLARLQPAPPAAGAPPRFGHDEIARALLEARDFIEGRR